MESIGERLIWYFIPFTDIPMPLGGLNILTVLNAAVVMVIIFVVCRYALRKRALLPDRGQMALELYTDIFDGLVSGSLELEKREQNRRFFPLIGTLFVFLLLANFIGFVPTHYFEEPTADINSTLGLGIMGMVIATFCAIRTKGFLGYIEELLGPLWRQPEAGTGARIAGKLSALFFFPLNIIGEFAKVVSISFRLFGNIIGGSIIIIVVSNLVYHFSFLAIGLDLFFIFFVGAVQAFVFTMLTLTYIAVAIK